MKKFFKNHLAVCLIMLISNFIYAQSNSVDSFLTGSGTWQVPSGVTSVTIELWGAGGGGGGSSVNNNGGSGGGSGAYTKKIVDVISGQQYSYSVGAGGSAGATTAGAVGGNGTSSTFVGLNLASSTNMTAGGGTGGTANAGSVGVGGATSGGDAGSSIAGRNGALGGTSGGSGGNAPGAGGTGGAAITNSPGNAGNAPGGGGGGGELIGSARVGGAGGNGKIRIAYMVTMDVELSDFKGENLNEKNKLNWATASETNNNYFILQKSETGENWEEVEKIYGAGNALETNYYEALDYKPYFPITYYRLKQVDFDGSLTYSDVISLTGEEINNNIVSDVYPNPASGIINFSFQGEVSKQLNINILNELGEMVSNSVLENPGIGHTYSLDMGSLASGNYFISVNQGNKIKNQKLQIQH